MLVDAPCLPQPLAPPVTAASNPAITPTVTGDSGSFARVIVFISWTSERLFSKRLAEHDSTEITRALLDFSVSTTGVIDP
ncbi:MAG: hypothetical protein ACHREM_21825 [Polyangiales bacterium]